jgi:hypothetical protein
MTTEVRGLAGIPYLIARSVLVRIEKADMTLEGRTNLAVSQVSLLWGRYREDPKFAGRIGVLMNELSGAGGIRSSWEPTIEKEPYAFERRTEMAGRLDRVEYQISELLNDTKAIDQAGVRDFDTGRG